MATQFLRKIILEELQKVLKEQAGLEVWKSGQAKVVPPQQGKEVEAGETTFVVRKPNKKVIKLQKTLKALGLYKCRSCVVDGILGNETKKAIAQMGGTSVERDPGLRSNKKIMANIDSYIAAASDRLATSTGVARPVESDVSAPVAPPAPPVATNNLGTTKKELEPEPVGPTAAQKAALEAQAKKEREERAKAQKALQPQMPRESIRREINKLLKML